MRWRCALLPEDCPPIFLADRGFAATAFFRALDALGWHWVIRSKGSVWVRLAGKWQALCVVGRCRPVLMDAAVDYGKRAHGGPYAGRLIIYGDGLYREPWHLIVSAGLASRTARAIVAAYGQRFTCEEAYRDQKNDPHEGFHVDCVRLGTAERWDRLWLVFAWAYYWLNVAGWVVEASGDARAWRANTTTNRTHALWRLGVWGLAHHAGVWRTVLRAQKKFRRTVPPIAEAPVPT